MSGDSIIVVFELCHFDGIIDYLFSKFADFLSESGSFAFEDAVLGVDLIEDGLFLSELQFNKLAVFEFSLELSLDLIVLLFLPTAFEFEYIKLTFKLNDFLIEFWLFG